MSNNLSFDPGKWIDEYADELFRYSLTRVGDSHFAEDIVQETFLSAWRSRETYKGEASEKNWLYAICKNKIIDHFRKHSTRPEITSSHEEDYYFDDADHWRKDPAPKNWGVNYHQPIESREFYSVLQKCKNKLKEIQQKVFVLKYMEEMDSEEICKELDITTSNYWVLIHRCKLSLRNCLEKNWLKL